MTVEQENAKMKLLPIEGLYKLNTYYTKKKRNQKQYQNKYCWY